MERHGEIIRQVQENLGHEQRDKERKREKFKKIWRTNGINYAFVSNSE